MSVAFYGDYDTTETVIIPFNTFTSDDPSASCTITNLAAADVEIHKDGGTTQRASDNGVTVTIDFDSITGNHIVSIDLSDNSDPGFYANGSRYQVRMEGTTIDSATVNAWIGSFSIGCTLRPTTAGRTLDVETGGCAGIDWNNIANPTTAQDLSATDIQLCDTVTTLTGHTAQTGDTYGALPTNFSDLSITASTGRVDVGEWLGQAVTLSTGNKPDVNVDEISDDATAAVNCEAAFDGSGYGFTGCTMPTVTTLTGHTPQTGDTYSELPTNFSDLAITVTNGYVTVGTNNDKTGYSISGTKTTLDDLNDISTTDVNTEVDTALSDIDLDHLIQVTAGAEQPTDGSYLDQIMHKDAGQNFDATTDSLEAIRDYTAPASTALTDATWTDARAGYLDNINGHTAQTGDTYGALPTNFSDLSITASTGRVDVASIEGSDATDQINAACDTALSDIDLDHLIQVSAGAEEPTIGSYLDQVMHKDGSQTFDQSTDSLEAIRDNQGSTPPTAAEIADAVWDESSAGHTDAGKAGQQLWTDVDAILVDTAEIGTAGAGLTDLGGMSTGMKAEVNAEVDTALTDIKLDHLIAVAESDDPVDNSIIAKMAASDGDWSGFSNATDSLEAIRDNQAAAADAVLLQNTTITVTDQTHFTLAAGSADDDAYNNMVAVLTDQATAEQKSVRTVSDYVGGTKTVTIDSAPDFTIATGDTIDLLAVAPGSTPPTAAQIADAVWDESSAGHTDAGKAGQQLWTDVDAILVDTGEIGTAGAGLTDLGGMSTTMKGEVNAEVDTALTTAIPGSPTADSINERIATLDDNYTAARAGYIDNINGHTAQTGDTYAQLPTNFSDLSISITTGRVDVALIEGSDATDQINAACDTAFTDYDPPTKAELDSGLAALNDVSSADVNAACDTALSDYDGPTKTEMDNGFAALNDISTAEVNAEVDTALADINLDHLVKSAVDTDFATTVHLDSVVGHIADNGTTATFDRTTDSQEAVRDYTAPASTALTDATWTDARAGYLDNINGHTPQTGDTYSELPTNFSDLSITATTGRVDIGSIEGSDATDQIRDSVVDDSTRIDASALNTLSSYAPNNTIADIDDISGLNDLSAAQVNAEVDTALADIGLDHLIQVTAGAEEPTDGSYLDQIMHKDGGQTFDPTTDSLEAIRDTAPLGTAMRGTDNAALAATALTNATWTDARAGYLDNINGHTAQTGDTYAELPTNFSDLSITATTGRVDIASIEGTDATDQIGDAVLDEVVEGSLTLRQISRIKLAALGGKSTGGGTSSVAFRDNADGKNRISATVDANGNRTAVTLDGS